MKKTGGNGTRNCHLTIPVRLGTWNNHKISIRISIMQCSKIHKTDKICEVCESLGVSTWMDILMNI